MKLFRIRHITATLILLIVVAVSRTNATPLTLSVEAGHTLAGHMEMLVDPSGVLSLEQILSDENRHRFTSISGFLNRGYTSDTVWLRCSMQRQNTFPEDAVLRLWPPYLDTVDVYIQTGEDPLHPASYRRYRVGDHHPVAERPIVDADFAVPLLLPQDRPLTTYIRVRTTSALNLICSVHSAKDYIRQGSYTVALQGGYLSIALVVFMINLVLFLRLHDRLYLHFSLYILSLFVLSLPASGIMTLIWPSLVHLLSDYMVGMGTAGALLFFSLFGNRLFASSENPWIHRYFMLLYFIAGATALSVPIGFYNRTAPVLFIASFASIFLLTWLSFRETRKGTGDAYLYLAAFGASNIGFGVQFLRLLGVVPVAWWNMNAIEISSVLNMVLMTLAMTERVNRAERLALESALTAEQQAVSLAEKMTSELVIKQKELEEALVSERQAFESQIRFADVISHEYRTPLAIICANLDIMEMKSDSRSCECINKQNLAKIKRAVARLVELLEISLDRENLDRSKLQLKHLELANYLHAIEQESNSLWEGRQLIFSSSMNCSVIIEADPAMLKTAIFNLIDNACKYSPEGTPVFVTCDADSNSAKISVRDSGSGIAPGELKSVFDKFFRGANSRQTRGVGIGLYLVRRIIELHEGQIHLESNRSGTTVSVMLPIHAGSGLSPAGEQRSIHE